jgi:hypothetical protein
MPVSYTCTIWTSSDEMKYCVYGFGPHLKPRGLEIRRSDHGGFVISTGSSSRLKTPGYLVICEETKLFCPLESKLRKFAISCKPEVYTRKKPRRYRVDLGQNMAKSVQTGRSIYSGLDMTHQVSLLVAQSFVHDCMEESQSKQLIVNVDLELRLHSVLYTLNPIW